ncbi:MAG: hypothetical protein VSS52_007470, partial [Thiotrichaceae bacterium]|nr:hypothetical protein [Thiotrichaceae bacterium]
SSLKSDELLAKFTATSLKAPPDLWMVVTTKRLGEQHHNQLKQASQKYGIAYFSIDAEGNEQSFLCALCANAPKIVVEHLKVNKLFLNETDAKNTLNYLNDLKQISEVQNNIQKLKYELLSENIGYADWQTKQNNWLLEQFNSEEGSRAAFRQNLAICESDTLVVLRKVTQNELDNWWQERKPKPFIMLGEEGDGKTWTIASWVASKLKQDDFPPVVFISATKIPTNYSNPQSLIIETLLETQQFEKPYEHYWERRLKRWLERDTKNQPVLLLVLDGLNENPNFGWIPFFDQLALWKNQIAVIATCRTTYWKNSLSNMPNCPVLKKTLESYDDEELQQILEHHGLQLNEFDSALHDLLRKPRYFALVIRLHSKLDTKGEVTVERLIYEDYKDKHDSLLSHEDFQELIITLAKKQLQKQEINNKPQLFRELEGYHEDPYKPLTELISSGIIKKEGRKWGLNKHNLILGLGLLVADKVEELVNEDKTEAEITEAITAYLEPYADITVSICGMALYQSLLQKYFPNIGRLTLFQAWVDERNTSIEDWQRIPAYFPLNPDIYIEMAEHLWKLDSHNYHAQDAFMVGFLKYRNNKNVRKVMIPAFQRWMGFIHLDGHEGRHARGHDEQRLINSQNAVKQAIGVDEIAETVSLFGYSFDIIEDEGLLQLSKFALAIMSQPNEKRASHIDAMTMGIIAGVAMGYPNFMQQLYWILRTARNDIESALLDKAKNLMEYSEETAQKSAYWLLNALGSEKLRAFYKLIPEEFHFKNAFWQEYEKDPCRAGLSHWKADNYLKCIETK